MLTCEFVLFFLSLKLYWIIFISKECRVFLLRKEGTHIKMLLQYSNSTLSTKWHLHLGIYNSEYHIWKHYLIISIHLGYDQSNWSAIRPSGDYWSSLLLQVVFEDMGEVSHLGHTASWEFLHNYRTLQTEKKKDIKGGRNLTIIRNKIDLSCSVHKRDPACVPTSNWL